MAKVWLKSGAIVAFGALGVLGVTYLNPRMPKAPDIRLHAYATSDTVLATVTKVTDGDTFKCLVFDSVPINVRLACIDAPELKQPFGEYSRIALFKLIAGKKIKLLRPYNTMDRYGRYICNVYNDSVHVNKEMVRLGMAFVYYDYCKDDDFFDLEQQAYFNNLGVHSITMLKPWDYRHQ